MLFQVVSKNFGCIQFTEKTQCEESGVKQLHLLKTMYVTVSKRKPGGDALISRRTNKPVTELKWCFTRVELTNVHSRSLANRISMFVRVIP